MKNLIIFAVISLGIVSCSDPQTPVELKRESHKNYEMYKVVRKSMASDITLPGEFIPFEEVELFPKVNGFVKNVYVDRGYTVKKGQILLVMEAPEIEQQLVLAKSKLDESQAVLGTKKEKYNRLSVAALTPGSVSPFDLESAHNDLISAEASVKTEEANVAAYQAMEGYLSINAPFDGVITQRNVHPGAFVGPNSQFKEPILVLKEVNKLRLTVFVPETFVDKLNEKGDVLFTINALPAKVFKGKICRVSHSVNEQNRSEAAEIDVFNETEIKPGMYAQVKVPLMASGNNSFVLPFSAIITNTERKYIVVIGKQKHANLVDVTEGITDGKTTEVFGNIPDNAYVLTKPDNEVKEGDLIE